MWSLIFKNIFYRKLQNSSIAFSVAVGIAILFCIVNICQGVNEGMRISKERMGADLIIIPGGVVIEHSLYLFGGATVNTYMEKDLLQIIEKIPGITNASPQFFTHTLTADCHDIGSDNRMLGYDPESDWIIKPWLKKLNKNSLSDNEVILGAKVPTWEQGRISILGTWYNIVAVAEQTGTSLDNSIFVSMNEARRVAGESITLKPIWQKEGDPSTLISAILVKTEPKANINLIVERIQNAGYLKVIVASEVKQRIIDQFTVLGLLLACAGILAALGALFHIFTRFYSLIVERQAEWGLYMALGASSKDIMTIVLGEAFLVTLFGSVSGIVLGGFLYLGGLELLERYQHFPFSAPSFAFIALTAATLSLALILFSLLAAWLSAYRINRIEPSIVMTRGEFD